MTVADRIGAAICGGMMLVMLGLFCAAALTVYVRTRRRIRQKRHMRGRFW